MVDVSVSMSSLSLPTVNLPDPPTLGGGGGLPPITVPPLTFPPIVIPPPITGGPTGGGGGGGAPLLLAGGGAPLVGGGASAGSPAYVQASYDDGLTFLTGLADGQVHAAWGQSRQSNQSVTMLLSAMILSAGSGFIFWRRRAERSMAGQARHRGVAPSHRARRWSM
jgi:hypothetical protein